MILYKLTRLKVKSGMKKLILEDDPELNEFRTHKIFNKLL